MWTNLDFVLEKNPPMPCIWTSSCALSWRYLHNINPLSIYDYPNSTWRSVAYRDPVISIASAPSLYFLITWKNPANQACGNRWEVYRGLAREGTSEMNITLRSITSLLRGNVTWKHITALSDQYCRRMPHVGVLPFILSWTLNSPGAIHFSWQKDKASLKHSLRKQHLFSIPRDNKKNTIVFQMWFHQIRTNLEYITGYLEQYLSFIQWDMQVVCKIWATQTYFGDSAV